MTILYLARHGETDDNARQIFQGQGGRGLNDRGRAQAARLAKRAAAIGFAAIVTSDLERAVETANVVARACNLAPERERDLREVDVGTWTGKAYAEVADLYPEQWAAWLAGLDVRRGGGETYAELAERVDRSLRRIALAHANKRILCVSHGGSIKAFIAKLLGVTGEGLRALGGVANAGLTVVEHDARGRIRLCVWNDTSHLEGLEVSERTD